MNQSKGKARPKTSNQSRPRNSGKTPSSVPKPLNGKGVMPARTAPAAQARGQRSSRPSVYQRTSNGARIVHRELIGTITGSTAFTVANTFAINPGLATAFPWLSTQAVGWEEYKFNKLRFCYYTRTTTAVPGSIMLVPDYDASDAAPANEFAAASYAECVEEVPWTLEFSTDLDPRALLEPGNRKYVRTGNLAANLDIKTYDGGNLFVCTVDGSAVNWGKLWVEYDVEFFKPQTVVGGAAAVQSGSITTTSASRASPFTGTQTQLGGLAFSGATATLTFNVAGQYFLEYNITGTVMTNTSPTITGAATINNLLGVQLANTAATIGLGIYTVNVLTPGQTMVFDFTASATTITASVVRVAPYLTANF